MIKYTLKSLGKIAVSGIIAFVILTLFCCFYYNTPPSHASEDGSTDYKWEANRFYSQGYEGLGWGKTNNDGYMNMFDYDDNMKIDILIMGSSQMQAREVDIRQSTASMLNALLEDETVYNIGIAEHVFQICARNLRAALNKYRPAKYVVLVTQTVSFSDDEMAFATSTDAVRIKSFDNNSGIKGLLRRNQYLRLINQQIVMYKRLQAGDVEEVEDFESFSDLNTGNNESLLTEMLQKISALAEEYGVRPIIAYHPSINIAADGTISFEDDPYTVAQFKRSCDDSGILFLNMSDRFKEEYENTYILPYGFSNTPVCQGHLNKYGHAMIADELYNLISEDKQ